MLTDFFQRPANIRKTKERMRILHQFAKNVLFVTHKVESIS